VSRAGVRVTGGTLRGRPLSVPPGVRPSEGMLREALFSIWSSRLAGARFLDLFAGSGLVAAEAVSRGADRAVAVESEPRSLAVLAANLRRLEIEERVAVRRGLLPAELRRLAGDEPDGFDLVFADPPYRFERYEGLLQAVGVVLAAGGEVVVEHAQGEELPERVGELVASDRRRYGGSALAFYRLPS
jgi:16S rRNA (guanine(966)-N(2))-methyltransferase RsmD